MREDGKWKMENGKWKIGALTLLSFLAGSFGVYI